MAEATKGERGIVIATFTILLFLAAIGVASAAKPRTPTTTPKAPKKTPKSPKPPKKTKPRPSVTTPKNPPTPAPTPAPRPAIRVTPGSGGKPDIPSYGPSGPSSPTTPSQPKSPYTPGTAEPEKPDFPAFGDIVYPYPTPGGYYQVVYGDLFLGTISDRSIAYRALLSAGHIAARDVGFGGDPNYDVAAANAFAKKVANDASRRVLYTDQIQCSGWNDLLFGTFGYQSSGTSKGQPTSAGRAIRLLPQHGPIQKMIASKETPVRSIALGSKSTAGDGKALSVSKQFTGNLEFLWLPAINLVTLWESKGEVVTSDGMIWPTKVDGQAVSMALPPSWVLDLGVTTLMDVSSVKKWGCGNGLW